LLNLLKQIVGGAGLEIGRFKKLWAAEGVAIAVAIRTGFPLTQPLVTMTLAEEISESKTDLDPTGSPEPEVPEEAPPADASDA
jgi:hypothetical protein